MILFHVGYLVYLVACRWRRDWFTILIHNAVFQLSRIASVLISEMQHMASVQHKHIKPQGTRIFILNLLKSAYSTVDQ